MGLAKVTTKLIHFAHPQKLYENVFLVDTGATDCIAPGDELERLGIQKEGKMSYELADGTVKEYPFGLVRIEFMGRQLPAGLSLVRPDRNRCLASRLLNPLALWSIQPIRHSSAYRPFP